jgi:hypothetical protein
VGFNPPHNWDAAVQAAIHIDKERSKNFAQMNTDKRDERRYVVSSQAGRMVKMS